MINLAQRQHLPLTGVPGCLAQAAIGEAEALFDVERDAQHVAEHDAQEAAMRDNHNLFARMALSQFCEDLLPAREQLIGTFGLGKCKVGGEVGLVLVKDRGVLHTGFSVGQPFEDAVGAFLQTLINGNGVAATSRNWRGRIEHPLEVAGIERGERLMLQPPRHGAGLGQATWRQRTIGLTLETTFGIPEGFAVADHDEVGGLHGFLISDYKLVWSYKVAVASDDHLGGSSSVDRKRSARI